MTALTDATKETFLRVWKETGYITNWDVYGKHVRMGLKEFLNTCLYPFANSVQQCLEVGCGGGFFTKYLVEMFQQIICLDIIPRPSFLSNYSNVRYVELPNLNFNCYGVHDDSIDFVWCVNLFCYLSLHATETYLKSIYRVCKPNAICVFLFGNSERNCYDKLAEHEIPWVSYPFSKACELTESAGFTDNVDLAPWCHDSILVCRKKMSESC